MTSVEEVRRGFKHSPYITFAFQLTLDLGEFDRLLASTNRPRVKAAIAALITSTQTALKSAKPKTVVPQDANKPKTNITASKLSTYGGWLVYGNGLLYVMFVAWDQSDKFVKIYITLKNSQSAGEDDHLLFLRNRRDHRPIQ